MQGIPGAASQAGLPGLDTANGRSILWDPQDPLLGTPDLVRMVSDPACAFAGHSPSSAAPAWLLPRHLSS